MQTASCPEVSVVIPVYNDPNGIRTTVRSVVEQNCDPENFEILVVDNGSTDRTPETVATLAAEHDIVTALSEPSIQSSYAARNRGIEAARGEILAFIDADMWVSEDWIETVTNTMRRNDCEYAGCAVEVTTQSAKPTLAAQYNISTGFPVETYLNEGNFAPTGCLVTYSWVFEEVGLFEETMISSGDKEFGQRVHAHGIKQCFLREITVYHPARNSVIDLCAKAYRIGRGSTQLARHSTPTHQATTDAHKQTNGSIFQSLNQILPVVPLEFYIRHREQIDVPTSRMLLLDLIHQIQFICQLVGRIDEWRRKCV